VDLGPDGGGRRRPVLDRAPLGGRGPVRRYRAGVPGRRGHLELLGVGARLHRDGSGGNGPQRAAGCRATRDRAASRTGARTGDRDLAAPRPGHRAARAQRRRALDPATPPMYAHARKDASPERVEQQGDRFFCRTTISRPRAKSWRASERGSRGRRWTWSGRARGVYPNPTWDKCSRCRFRSPCIAMNRGEEVRPIIEGLLPEASTGCPRARPAGGDGMGDERRGASQLVAEGHAVSVAR
jgi:hypothetical protein